MEKMTISSDGKMLIKTCEGLLLEAYRCKAGVWTIGWGHTSGVVEGMKITREEAEKFFEDDISVVESFLNKMGINFRQNQFDALTSFIFNIGTLAFKRSTCLKRIIEDWSDDDIASEILRWVYVDKEPSLGLKARRVTEANIFLGCHKYYVDDKGNINLEINHGEL